MATPSDPLYASQWHFGLIGNIERIWDEYSGLGVRVGVYDSGVDFTHEDLSANYDASLHVVDNTLAPVIPAVFGSAHGTAVSGLIAATLNSAGGVGVAWGASITGVQIFDSAIYGFVNAADQSGFLDVVGQAAKFDVMSNSWGSYADFSAADDTGTRDVYTTISASGRGGLGTVIVQSAGNDNLDANGTILNASRFTITVAATLDTGYRASYSNLGASILVAGPAAAVTTDITGADGYDPGEYTTSFNGTSAAAPVVSGVVSLMLDANGGLGWRDVQNILALSATLTGNAFDTPDPANPVTSRWYSNGGDTWNGGGSHVSADYGHGMVNAYNAVRMVEVWNLFGAAQTSANEVLVQSGLNDFADQILPDGVSNGGVFESYSTTFTITGDVEIEHVDLHLDFSAEKVGDLRVWLTSAEGTEIRMKFGNSGLTNAATGNWSFGAEGFRGELSAGTWTMRVDDVAATNQTIVRSASLDIYGSAASANDVYHFTDEYLAMLAFQAGRGAVTDSNGGTDWLNLAAVTGAVALDMTSGQTFTVDAVNWATLSGDFERAITGDGDDTITGNALDNALFGMRGGDTISGGDGNDILIGGAGGDSLTGGLGTDTASYDGAAAPATIDLAVPANNTGDALGDVYSGIEILLLSGNADTFIASNTETYRVRGGGGIDTLTGAVLSDLFFGEAGADSLLGDAGNDFLYGGGDADALSGGAGLDYLDGGVGGDTLTGGGDNDKYIVDDVADVVVELAGGGIDRLYASVSLTGANAMDAEVEYGALLGGAALDLEGNASDNILVGNAGVNQLLGGGGNDKLQGLGGDDTMTGGEGNDFYFVADNGDVAVEGSGPLDGSLDVVYSTAAAAVLGLNIEYAYLTGTADIGLTGNSQNNRLIGNSGANIIAGGLGGDLMLGRAGNDTLQGEAGNDKLIGGLGQDSLAGGTFNDSFAFETAADSSATAGLEDVIADFAAGDRIDLVAIDANSGFGGNEAFTFLGVGAFNNTDPVGQLRYAASGPDTRIEADVNGDQVADFAILVTGVHAFAAGDFFL